MGQVAELRVIKEQLKEKQEVLEAEMEASRREKKTQAEEVTFALLKKVLHFMISVCLLEDKAG